MTVSHGHAYFCSGGRIYRKSLYEGEAEAITPGFGHVASPQVSPDGRWVLFVHSYEEDDCLAIVDVRGSMWPQKVVQGADFYMQPVWHPKSEHVAWVSWDHPRMPWDGSRLGIAAVEHGGSGVATLGEETIVAGGPSVSVFQPAFSPDGRYLSYVSDLSGWYNLYLYDTETEEESSLVVAQAELAKPAWVQGMRTYAWSPDSKTIYYSRNQHGVFALWSVNVETRETGPVEALSPYTHTSQVNTSPSGHVAVIASSARIPPRVVVYDPGSEDVRVMAHADTEMTPSEILSEPQPISWEMEAGPVHGLLYMPKDDRYDSSGRPPLIVMVHGGPTSQSLAEYSSKVQFLATRGYAILELNYRGSTGYGRDYRNELRGQWGIVDVDDAVAGVRYLVERGLVDEEKLVIMGGSAGGYSVLQALIRYPGVFKAGVCLYGVTNLFTLAVDTHKFEKHYLDSLVGPLPEEARRYRERSPIFHADRIEDPVAIFQGEEDRVVPVQQAETIVEALRRNGVPHEYHLYSEEGHGWRKAKTIERFYQSLEEFLKQHVLFA
jgi:dipeptidyl aminopeptidase/acylaminoacyl peptidase